MFTEADIRHALEVCNIQVPDKFWEVLDDDAIKRLREMRDAQESIERLNDA